MKFRPMMRLTSILILPKTIVFCEGSCDGVERKSYDKSIYEIIFAETHPEAVFIS